MAALLLGLITAECYALYRGQREIFGWGQQLLPAPVNYALVFPGTVLHELSHLLACLLLLVPVHEVTLFKPVKKGETIWLGSVIYVKPGWWRQTLIAVAPLFFIPVMLIGVSWGLLGPSVFTDPLAAIAGTSPVMLLLWAYICLSAGQMAFPSVEDHVPLPGALCLGGLAFVILMASPALLSLTAIVLLLPACMAIVFWVSLRVLMHRRGLRPAQAAKSGPKFHRPRRRCWVCTSCLSKVYDDGVCPSCGGHDFYRAATASGSILSIPAALGIPCQECGRADRDIQLRSFHHPFPQSNIKTTLATTGYWCRGCQWRLFWRHQGLVLIRGGWSPWVWPSKLRLWLANSWACFAAPSGVAEEMTIGTINKAREAIGADQRSTHVPRPAPSWFLSLPRGDQRLLASRRDFYAELKISPGVDHRALKVAYREAVKAAHPDVGGSEEAMQRINDAYRVIGDDRLRYAVDHLSEVPPEYLAHA